MRKVLILGGDSDYNLGDAAILAALCTRFAASGATSITFTSSLANPPRPPGATTVIPRGAGGLSALCRAANKADLVVIGGGGLLQDDDSRVKMPYWASRIAVLRLANRNLVGHSVGAGPLQHLESRVAARFTCSALASITVRDAFAQTALQSCTPVPIEIVPDPAFMLDAASAALADALLASVGMKTGRPIIGMCLRKWFHARGGFVPSRARIAMGLDDHSGDAALAQLLEKLAAAIVPVATAMGASILLLPTYSADYENDAHTCETFARLIGNCEVRIARITDPALYKAVTARLSVMVSSRMHPLILAAGMGTPVVGLAYNGKFEGMFDMLKIPRRMIWLADAADELPVKVRALIEQALNSDEDLQHKASLLAALVSSKTSELLRRDVPRVAA